MKPPPFKSPPPPNAAMPGILARREASYGRGSRVPVAQIGPAPAAAAGAMPAVPAAPAAQHWRPTGPKGEPLKGI